jgi:MOSC domain-containing protein YiiM
MSLTLGHIAAVFVGGPKTLSDDRGEWRSSIARDRVSGVAELEVRGFVGDQVTQSYHGSLETAVCLHSLTHYCFWNSTLQMALQPGAVGENLTFDEADDSNVCVGDVFRIGSAHIQISAPRTPCENQARHIGRSDWVKRTIEELRTGMYARVLIPGTLQAGDQVVLEARPNPGLTVYALNHCYYRDCRPEIVERFGAAEGLMDWWKQRLRERAGERL